MKSSKINYVGSEETRNSRYTGEKGPENVTVSIGFTTYPTITNAEEGLSKLLIQHADRAMYKAKKWGKNRVMAYSKIPKS